MQGPVDPQNPVVRPSGAAPEPVPVIAAPPPRATPSPRRAEPTASPSPRATPQTRETPTLERSDAPERAETPAPQPSASATPKPTPSPVAPLPSPAPVATPTPDAASKAQPAQTQSGGLSWWWMIPLAMIIAAGLMLMLRRRQKASDDDAYAVPDIRPDRPVAPPPAAPLMPEAVTPPRAAAPARSAFSDAVDLQFEPVGLRLSLVYATLQYRITLNANEGFPPSRLYGDMIGAHGSIPVDEQLAPAIAALRPLRSVDALSGGESKAVTGEVQLPLSAIRAVRQGNASLFVPLVRLCLVPEGGEAGLRRVYTVGVPTDAALAPLRLDTGTQELRGLAAREVETARIYPVLPVADAPLPQAV
ncbi:hypothetical protein ASE49_04000 [Novosphingobium sp. Leaf2]|nr:hypothetical protein ASE49_04000 [Novosphingobium sp. Leaf2]